MTDQTTHSPVAALVDALSAPSASTRLRAAMAAGTRPDPALTDELIRRCRIEPDFFVRDMLTWALTRLPADVTVPRLVVELNSEIPQARSQSLHTLSKIGDRSAWPSISSTLLHDTDDEVARAAWRTAVALVPDEEVTALAVELARELGRGHMEVQRSLSRAIVELGDAALGPLGAARAHPDPVVRIHVAATERLMEDPDSDFGAEAGTAC
ncbi:HEAT repeat domain-containing protein [Gordonia jinghuaiqii]|uniref:HEAT repeat domain-containing protein n=1 Tax=Gordonia jinghuaiqii TaxID=2758710 RepID=A0A7D7LZV4_9ACTN|nr:HEAT repeat domain-containing protein [Gordonia jinghuaiqii]MCR5978593.1 HEAT repeat domain-containing protein [Gordonia jinghuaiqii]QMT02914.1 HEAT repeat domain-containing protein [Gordonia jinghuaiqii]